MFFNGRMDQSMKGILSRAKNKDLACINFLMGVFLKVSGAEGNKMVKEFYKL